jgi:hypothetical protein
MDKGIKPESSVILADYDFQGYYLYSLLPQYNHIKAKIESS